MALSVNAKQVAKILRSETGHNTIFTVRVAEGAEEKAMMKDWQVDPFSGSLLHVDMLRIAMDVRMRVRVPVHTFGEPQGVKLQGGIFEMVTREVEIECLPSDIPEEFKVDVSRPDDRQAASRRRRSARSGKDETGHRSAARDRARRDAQEGRRARCGSGGGCRNRSGRARSHQEGQEGRRGRGRRREAAAPKAETEKKK